jgi:hypothetical protein
MLIIREVFTAKPGQASKLAKLFKKVMGPETNMRIMTDMVGSYNTVVTEYEVKSLAEFEQQMQAYKSGKEQRDVPPDVAEEMSKYTEMYISGRREIYQIVD